MKNILLTVIMPVYNVEATISRALDSILMQETNFDYEVIAVDDCSTDNTINILKKYQEKNPKIKIIQHERNLGNAMGFYNGLSASLGKYFCVLDGDDFYSVRNKLQKQVNFLEHDINKDYVAVAHEYLTVDNDYNFLAFPKMRKKTEYTYIDFLKFSFYFHTSTYMYRNIFQGNVPEHFKEDAFRGDNPRTFLHLLHTKSKVKVLQFVGSVYRFTNTGIWTSLDHQKQKERNLKFLHSFYSVVKSELEKKFLGDAIKNLSESELSDKNHKTHPSFDSSSFLEYYNQNLRFSFNAHESFFADSTYKIEFFDSLAESVGSVEKYKNNISLSNPLLSDPETILLNLDTSVGNKTYQEIIKILDGNSTKKLNILFVNHASVEELDDCFKAIIAEYPSVGVYFANKNISEAFKYIIQLAPSKIYHFIKSDNLNLVALIQSSISQNICVVAEKNGLLLGLDSSSHDEYLVRNSDDFSISYASYTDKAFLEQKLETNRCCDKLNSQVIDVANTGFDLLEIPKANKPISCIKKRYKLFFYALFLAFAQIPFLGNLVSKKRRNRLTAQIEKYWY